MRKKHFINFYFSDFFLDEINSLLERKACKISAHFALRIVLTKGFCFEKYCISFTCSPIEGERRRWIIRSFPSVSIIRGDHPVVLAMVLNPPALNPAAIRRVTLDLPLDPFT